MSNTEYRTEAASNGKVVVIDRINNRIVGWFTADKAVVLQGRNNRQVTLDDEFVASCGAAGAIAYMAGLA
jgi:hypothetical protein